MTAPAPPLRVSILRARSPGVRDDHRSEGVQSYKLTVNGSPQPPLTVNLSEHGPDTLGPALQQRIQDQLGSSGVRIITDAAEVGSVCWTDALFPAQSEAAGDVWIEASSIERLKIAPSTSVRDLTQEQQLDRDRLEACLRRLEERWRATDATGINLEAPGADVEVQILGKRQTAPTTAARTPLALIRVHIGGTPLPQLSAAPLVADVVVETAQQATDFVESFLVCTLADLLPLPRAILAAHRWRRARGDGLSTRLSVPPEWEDARAARVPPWPGDKPWHQGRSSLYPGRWESPAREIIASKELADFTLVLGPLGSGKTSFVLAGIFGQRPGSKLSFVRIDEPEDLLRARNRISHPGDPFAIYMSELVDNDPRMDALASADWFLDAPVPLVATAQTEPTDWQALVGDRSQRTCQLGAPDRAAMQHILRHPAQQSGHQFDAGLVEQILDDAMTWPPADRLRRLSQRLWELWNLSAGLRLKRAAWLGRAAGRIGTAVAALTSDSPLTTGANPKEADRLDFWQHVDAFSTIILSRHTHLPLSIGLFGDWGSGKSFFMKSLSHALDDRARQIRAASEVDGEHWHPRIVPIHFNAWHYADADLWAGLVHQLFKELSEWLAAEEDGQHELDPTKRTAADAHHREQVQLAMLSHLQTTRRRVAAAQAAREEIQDRLAREEEARQSLLYRTRTALGGAMDVLLSDVGTGATQDHEKTKESDRTLTEAEQNNVDRLVSLVGQAQAVRALTGDAELTSARDLQQLGSDLQSTFPWHHYLSWMVRGPHLWMRLVFMAAMVLGAYGLHNLVDFVEMQFQMCQGSQPPALCGFFAPTIGWVTGFVTTVLGPLTLFWQRVKHAAPDLVTHLPDQPTLARRLSAFHTVEGKLRRQRHAASRERAAADAAVAAAQQQLSQAERDLHQARTGQQLQRFVEDAAGDRYRQHLGLMSTINEDLDNLGQILQELEADRAARRRLRAGGTELEGEVPAAPRIVLFIDDLDRCPPARVVEVLEAVHLLLAKPLFVVVVAVDARWLLRSVDTHFQSLVDASTATPIEGLSVPRRPATPRHYLEKIFQVPFQVPRMTTDGYTSLVEQIAGFTSQLPTSESVPAPQPSTDAEATGATEQPSTTAPTSDDTAPEAPPAERAATEPAEALVSVVEPAPAPATDPDTDPDTEPGPVGLPAPHLVQFTPREVSVLRCLGPIVATPRATKRLVNTARLVRLHGDPLTDWQAISRPAFLLLALEVSAPELWRRLRALLRQDGWEVALQSLMNLPTADTTSPQLPRLKEVLEALQAPILGGPLSSDPQIWSAAMHLTERFAFITDTPPNS